MSILPTQAQGTTSSSPVQSSSPHPTPPSHGQLSPVSLSNLSRQFQSLHFPDPQPPPAAPGPPIAAAEDSGGSSQKVIELGMSSGHRSSPQPEGLADPQYASASSGAGSVHPKAKMSRGTSSPQREHTGSSQGGNYAGSSRRAQMMNANHLLNFHYDPIVRSQTRPPPRKYYKIKPYNKDLFLQANYRFVVLDTGNYSPELMDPDKMLQWEDIICLRYSTPAPVQCPICLDDPLCPQITSCGHIFCFPCILQYLLMGKEDEKDDCFKRCPLCFTMVSLKDLYTIYIENVLQYNVGDTIEFMLLTRAKDSFAPAQKCKQETGEGSNCSVGDPFSKFTFTTDVDLSVRKAMSDLDGWLARAESGLVDDLEKLPYVSAAIRLLKQRKKYWSEHHACSRDRSSEYAESQYRANEISSSGTARGDVGSKHTKQPVDISDQSEPLESALNDEFDRVALEGRDTTLSSSYDETDSEILHKHSYGHGFTKEKESYNFYQAVDGQHIILHPLTMKCLLHHYGSYDMLPNRISGRILQMETVNQSEATRRRYRYLSHFSLTTIFQLCEIDLSGTLPPHALMPFMDEIKKREKQRKQLANKERKEKIKAEVAAAAAAAADYMPVSFSTGQCSAYDSPQFSLDDFEALGGSTTMSSSPPTFGERTSFSNVTRLGFAAGHDSPALKIEPNAPGANAVGADTLSAAGSRNPDAPSFANVMSRGQSGENLGAPKMNETGKKGKKQSRVLLSTASGRRY